jgi:hypothetical protein
VHRISEPSKFNTNCTSPVLHNPGTNFWFTYTSHSELQVKVSMYRLSLLLSIRARQLYPGGIPCETCRTKGNDKKKTPCIINSFVFYIRTAQRAWHPVRTDRCTVDNFRRPTLFIKVSFHYLLIDSFPHATKRLLLPPSVSKTQILIINTFPLFTVNKIRIQNGWFKNKFQFTVPDIHSIPAASVSTIQMRLSIARSRVAPYNHSRLGV